MTGVCHVFVGPTSFGVPPGLLRAPWLVLHEPAARGDLGAIRSNLAPGDAIALVDGRFGDVLSVGHREIAQLLSDGVQVWGLSSMGAIRAAEMAVLGMKRFGIVAQQFIDDPDFSDDEVTLVHLPIPPYEPVSEPLVHLRVCLDAMCRRGDVQHEVADAIIEALRNLWFGHRTWELLSSLLRFHSVSEERILDATSDLNMRRRYRTKSQDLENFVREKPWISHAAHSTKHF